MERRLRFSIGKNNLSPPAYSIIKQSWGILLAKIDLNPLYLPIPWSIWTIRSPILSFEKSLIIKELSVGSDNQNINPSIIKGFLIVAAVVVAFIILFLLQIQNFRSKKLSGDKVPSVDALYDCVRRSEKYFKENFEYILNNDKKEESNFDLDDDF